MKAPVIEFKNWIEPEMDVSIDGNALASGDPEADAAAEQWVRDQLEAGNEAAWCIANVSGSVSVERIDGDDAAKFGFSDSLGACSWPSEKELWKDLLDEMKDRVLDGITDLMQKDGSPEVMVALDWILENREAIVKAPMWKLNPDPRKHR